ncbi:fasciclin domain-containing protein [Haloferula sargassicola]|uniref:FAS1 domain-containing protein n=1 Tax=Haloferula sargassicola TaxID=490096 RepID=A0ABP9UT51_9BACT
MKLRNSIIALGLVTATPAILAQGEKKITGDPAQNSQIERTDTSTGPNESTDQPTGAREMRDAGAPSKTNVPRTKRDTVDATGTVADALRDAENFTTLNKAVDAAGLREVLDQPGPYTVFAPTDKAFDKIPQETLDEWMKPENKDQLSKVLLGHVVAGEMVAGDFTPGTVSTSASTTLQVTVNDDKIMINDATVTQPDIRVSNGVIHAIDAVLVPEMEQSDADDTSSDE